MNVRAPYIVVAGLGRCGTSLLMQMLDAGGIPCIGPYPAFEPEALRTSRAIDPAFLARYPGHAFKLLDPHRTPLPPIPGVLIWLDRELREQARSQAKFATLMMGVPMANRVHLRRWASGLRADRERGLAPFEGWPRLVLRFEDIIRRPDDAALLIAARLRPWFNNINEAAMAAQVRPRSTDCAPGLDLELSLIAASQVASVPSA